MTDEPRYTKQQVAAAIRQWYTQREWIASEGTVTAVLKCLDPPARTCRCGKWTWVERGGKAYWWNDTSKKSATGGEHWGLYCVCSGCRCALLEEGKVSEPLFTWDEDHKRIYGHNDTRFLFYDWLRDRPLQPAPE